MIPSPVFDSKNQSAVGRHTGGGMNTSFSEKNVESSDKRIICSEELFKGSREIIIEHDQDQYRLLITKSGKLILNK